MSVHSSRRRRERRQEQIEEARRQIDQANRDHWTEDSFREAVAFIRSPDSIQPGERVVGLLRVSKWDQDTDGQKEAIRQAVRERGGVVVEWFTRIGMKGHSKEWFAFKEKVFAWCAERQIRFVVVSEFSRLVRSPEFGPQNHQAQPSVEQLEQDCQLAEKYGITIVSINPPDRDSGKERGWQSRRGNSPPGRPRGNKTKQPGWRKARKDEFQGRVFELLDRGKSLRDTANIVSREMRSAGWRGISYQTVAVWDKERQDRDREDRIGGGRRGT